MKTCSICGEEIDSWHIGGHMLDYHIECVDIDTLVMIKELIEKRIDEVVKDEN